MTAPPARSIVPPSPRESLYQQSPALSGRAGSSRRFDGSTGSSSRRLEGYAGSSSRKMMQQSSPSGGASAAAAAALAAEQQSATHSSVAMNSIFNEARREIRRGQHRDSAIRMQEQRADAEQAGMNICVDGTPMPTPKRDLESLMGHDENAPWWQTDAVAMYEMMISSPILAALLICVPLGAIAHYSGIGGSTASFSINFLAIIPVTHTTPRNARSCGLQIVSGCLGRLAGVDSRRCSSSPFRVCVHVCACAAGVAPGQCDGGAGASFFADDRRPAERHLRQRRRTHHFRGRAAQGDDQARAGSSLALA